MAETTRTLELLLTARDRTGAAFSSADKGLKSLAAGLNRLKIVAPLAAAAFAKMAQSAASSAIEDVTATQMLIKTLNQQGRAWDEVSRKVNDWVTSAMEATAIGDTELTQMLQRAAIFAGSLEGGINAANIALKIQAATGRDATRILTQVGQAFEGNVAALGTYVPALRRVTKEQADQMTAAERQRLVMEAVQKQFGDVAAITDTMAGQFKLMKTAAAEAFEQFGQGIITSVRLNEGMAALGKSILSNEELMRRLRQAGQAVGNVFSAIIGFITSIVRGFASQVRGTAAVGRSSALLADILAALKGTMQLLGGTVGVLSGFIGNTLVRAIKLAAGTVSRAVNIFKGFGNIIAGIFTLDPKQVLEGVRQIGEAAAQQMRQTASTVIAVGKDAVRAVIGVFQAADRGLSTFARGVDLSGKAFKFGDMVKVADSASAAVADLGSSAKVAGAASEAATAQVDKATSSIRRQAEVAETTQERLERLITAYRRIAGEQSTASVEADSMADKVQAQAIAVEAAKRQLDAMREKLQELIKEHDIADDAVAQFKTQVAAQEQKVALFEERLSNLTLAMSLQQAAAKGLASIYATVDNVLGKVSNATGNLIPETERLAFAVATLESAEKRLQERLDEARAALIGLVATGKDESDQAAALRDAIASLEARMRQLRDSAADLRGRIDELSEPTRRAAEFFAKLFAAAIVGDDVARLTMQIAEMREEMVKSVAVQIDAAEATGEAIDKQVVMRKALEGHIRKLVELKASLQEGTREFKLVEDAIAETSAELKGLDVTVEQTTQDADVFGRVLEERLSDALLKAAQEGRGLGEALVGSLRQAFAEENLRRLKDDVQEFAASVRQMIEKALSGLKVDASIKGALEQLVVSISSGASLGTALFQAVGKAIGGPIGKALVALSGFADKAIAEAKRVFDRITGRAAKRRRRENEAIQRQLEETAVGIKEQFGDMLALISEDSTTALAQMGRFADRLMDKVRRTAVTGSKAVLNELRAFRDKAVQEFQELQQRVQAFFQAAFQFIGQTIGEAFKAGAKMASLEQGLLAFTKTLKENVFDAVLQGMIDAALQSKLVQQTFLPFFDALQTAIERSSTGGFRVFRDLMQDAIGRLQERIPALQTLFAELQTLAEDVRILLGVPQLETAAAAAATSNVTVTQTFILNAEVASDMDVFRTMDIIARESSRALPQELTNA